MPVTVVIQLSPAPQLHSGFRIALGVEFDHLDPVAGDKGQEGDKMLLGHGVVYGDKMLVLYAFYGYLMVAIRLFCIKGREGYSATIYMCITHGSNYISANGTNVKE